MLHTVSNVVVAGISSTFSGSTQLLISMREHIRAPIAGSLDCCANFGWRGLQSVDWIVVGHHAATTHDLDLRRTVFQVLTYGLPPVCTGLASCGMRQSPCPAVCETIAPEGNTLGPYNVPELNARARSGWVPPASRIEVKPWSRKNFAAATIESVETSAIRPSTTRTLPEVSLASTPLKIRTSSMSTVPAWHQEKSGKYKLLRGCDACGSPPC